MNIYGRLCKIYEHVKKSLGLEVITSNTKQLKFCSLPIYRQVKQT
jgi:hypothetical protein